MCIGSIFVDLVNSFKFALLHFPSFNSGLLYFEQAWAKKRNFSVEKINHYF
ncbi:hypothetical protein BY458DRAFT_109176 [Sporodiniella umbellata]|nr:hypothetical protein BY458DRAFT_109176 [Sporodiniella umbellata]